MLISIDTDTGVLSVAQYLSLFHPDGSDVDDTVFLGTGLVSAKVLVTDGDGDTDTDSVDLGGATAAASTIKFDDDAPNDIFPDAALMANSGDAVGSGALDFFGNSGADEPGDVVFVDTNPADDLLSL